MTKLEEATPRGASSVLWHFLMALRGGHVGVSGKKGLRHSVGTQPRVADGGIENVQRHGAVLPRKAALFVDEIRTVKCENKVRRDDTAGYGKGELGSPFAIQTSQY
ncbi:MAG: hypothetical protein ACRCUF_14820 [Aeromonas sobria]